MQLGIMMRMFDKSLPPVVGSRAPTDAIPEPSQLIHNRRVRINGNLTMINADLPASRKATGSAAVTHKTQMCDECNMTYADLNEARAYDIDGVVPCHLS